MMNQFMTTSLIIYHEMWMLDPEAASILHQEIGAHYSITMEHGFFKLPLTLISK